MKTRSFQWLSAAFCAAFLLAPAGLQAQAKGTVIEEIVARVNNEIITLSEYQKAGQDLVQEVQQDCQNCPPAQIDTMLKDRQKNLLRDMIDRQLLIERAKDMDISVETDVIKRLDDVRKQNNLPTMEDLQKAVEGQGLVWEDYKAQMRNELLTQEVIRREVGGRMDISNEEVKKYYDEHKSEFNRPEEVELADIFQSTEGKSPEEIAAVRTKADDLHNRLVKGDDFSQLAKRYSEGTTAQDGGYLGVYQRSQLSKELEDAVFALDKGQVTDVIQTKTGFEIIKVLNHFQAGLQPLDKVEGEISNQIYMTKMKPAMRDYLAELREESYVQVKAGYTDTAAIPGGTVIQEVAPTPDSNQKKKDQRKAAKAGHS